VAGRPVPSIYIVDLRVAQCCVAAKSAGALFRSHAESAAASSSSPPPRARGCRPTAGGWLASAAEPTPGRQSGAEAAGLLRVTHEPFVEGAPADRRAAAG
jgi:hypothetical protein